MKGQIAKIGFEIEGEFSNELQEVMNGLGEMVGDGSVRTCKTKLQELRSEMSFMDSLEEMNRKSLEAIEMLPHGNLSPREFRTFPIPIQDIEKTSGRIFKVLNEYAGKKQFHWNDSAGFHIHISFKRKMCHEIWSAQFAKYFHKNLKKRFKKVVKERGTNHYCRIRGVTEKQIADQNTSRYQSINFSDALRKHGTIEFRIFPADKPANMQRYLNFTIGSVNKFIEQSDTLLRKKIKVVLASDTREIELETLKIEEYEPEEEGTDHYGYDGGARIRQYDALTGQFRYVN